jgi:hypothetical protein
LVGVGEVEIGVGEVKIIKEIEYYEQTKKIVSSLWGKLRKLTNFLEYDKFIEIRDTDRILLMNMCEMINSDGHDITNFVKNCMVAHERSPTFTLY